MKKIYGVIFIYSLLLIGTGQAGYITSHDIYKNYDAGKGQPIDQTYNFTTSDTMVVSWIYLEDMNVGDKIVWDLYDPKGDLYKKEIHDVRWSGSGWAYSYYHIRSMIPGIWKIVISLNNKIEATDTFHIQGSISHYGDDCIKCHNSPNLQTFWALHANSANNYRHINVDIKSGMDVLDNNDCIMCHYDTVNIAIWNGSSFIANVIPCSKCKKHDTTVTATFTPITTVIPKDTPIISVTSPIPVNIVSRDTENIENTKKHTDVTYKFGVIYIVAIMLSILLIYILRKK